MFNSLSMLPATPNIFSFLRLSLKSWSSFLTSILLYLGAEQHPRTWLIASQQSQCWLGYTQDVVPHVWLFISHNRQGHLLRSWLTYHLLTMGANFPSCSTCFTYFGFSFDCLTSILVIHPFPAWTQHLAPIPLLPLDPFPSPGDTAFVFLKK